MSNILHIYKVSWNLYRINISRTEKLEDWQNGKWKTCTKIVGAISAEDAIEKIRFQETWTGLGFTVPNCEWENSVKAIKTRGNYHEWAIRKYQMEEADPLGKWWVDENEYPVRPLFISEAHYSVGTIANKLHVASMW